MPSVRTTRSLHSWLSTAQTVRSKRALWATTYMESCAVSKAPKSQWRSIKARYQALIEDWQAKMDLDSWFRSEMAGVEERVFRGEEPEKVLQDLRDRLAENYGEAAKPEGDNASSGT